MLRSSLCRLRPATGVFYELAAPLETMPTLPFWIFLLLSSKSDPSSSVPIDWCTESLQRAPACAGSDALLHQPMRRPFSPRTQPPRRPRDLGQSRMVDSGIQHSLPGRTIRGMESLYVCRKQLIPLRPPSCSGWTPGLIWVVPLLVPERLWSIALRPLFFCLSLSMPFAI